jgi:hypothetical protein
VPGNDDAKNRSRDAQAPEVYSPPRHQEKIASGKKGKRSAERRMPSMSALTQTSGRNVRHSSAPRLRAPSKRGAPAFRRPRSRHSPKALTPMAQPQNRVSSRHGAPGVLPVRRARLELSTLRADRSLCRPTGDPEPPECGLAIPPAGTAPRSASLACLSGKALLVSELVLT